MNLSEAQIKINEIKNNIKKEIVGKDDIIDLLMIGLIADGHILLEDLPGTGKTTLAKTLAVTIDAEFSRIQFTPDLLPSDIVGLNIYNRQTEKFNFISGPIMTNILLADEINRATPRTQSALLEAMQERQVTVDGESRKLESPFFVIATQNPVETAGTFPLPEAELDRFMMMLSLGAMSVDEEVKMLQRFEKNDPIKELSAVASKEDIIEMRKLIDDIFIHEDLIRYISRIADATRADSGTYMGVSPRGSIALLKASKAKALLEGRDYVLPDDIKALAVHVFAHRIICINRKDKASKEQFLEMLINEIEVPSEEFNVR